MKTLEKIIKECNGHYTFVSPIENYCPFLSSYGHCKHAKYISKGLIGCNYPKNQEKEDV
jgi:hypothetical protein